MYAHSEIKWYWVHYYILLLYYVGHGDELVFVFRTFDTWWDKQFKPTPDELQLSHEMMAYWTNFAKDGNPNGGNLTKWPKYSNQFISFDTPTNKVHNILLMNRNVNWCSISRYRTAIKIKSVTCGTILDTCVLSGSFFPYQILAAIQHVEQLKIEHCENEKSYKKNYMLTYNIIKWSNITGLQQWL